MTQNNKEILSDYCMTTENFVHKNIYLFGECYFSNDLS